jgi:hypothetical protein
MSKTNATPFLNSLPKEWALQILLGEGLATQQLIEDGQGLTGEQISDLELTTQQHLAKTVLIMGYMLNQQNLFTIDHRLDLAAEVDDGLREAVDHVLSNVYNSLNGVYSVMERDHELIGSTGDPETVQ